VAYDIAVAPLCRTEPGEKGREAVHPGSSTSTDDKPILDGFHAGSRPSRRLDGIPFMPCVHAAIETHAFGWPLA
jgi:hypothetical protein